ncbi:hypothetical protein [Caballeronia sp. LjRoot31]|jgi:hypothetical protein|uniref:hypothetical protein n=1 Tax=Caballeronia sp. LjRoot31 TaxID=3342324 RepID=UPI003ECDEE43
MKKAAFGLLFLLAFEETAMHALTHTLKTARFRANPHNQHALIRTFLRVTCG